MFLPKITFKKDLKSLLNQKINLISKKVLDYTPQLYYKEKNCNDAIPNALASSVLYRNQENYYLITAKHVFNNQEEWDIGILIDKFFYSLEGTKYQIQDNNIDITVCKLTNTLRKVLAKNYNFLNTSQVGEKHSYKKSITRYLEIGFPITRSKLKKHDKTIRVNPFILISDIYKHTKEHVYVNIPKTRKSFNNNIPVRTLPTLTGLSGCGLWYISNFYRAQLKLVAIMVEWDDKHKQYTKGTNINIVVEMIKEFE